MYWPQIRQLFGQFQHWNLPFSGKIGRLGKLALSLIRGFKKSFKKEVGKGLAEWLRIGMV